VTKEENLIPGSKHRSKSPLVIELLDQRWAPLLMVKVTGEGRAGRGEPFLFCVSKCYPIWFLDMLVSGEGRKGTGKLGWSPSPGERLEVEGLKRRFVRTRFSLSNYFIIDLLKYECIYLF